MERPMVLFVVVGADEGGGWRLYRDVSSSGAERGRCPRTPNGRRVKSSEFLLLLPFIIIPRSRLRLFRALFGDSLT